MGSKRLVALLLFGSGLLIPLHALGDYSYRETTQVTGGSMLRMMKMAGTFSSQARKIGEPVVSTVYLKGNRMARESADSIEIVDLDKETITQIDKSKRTYSVMTFEQLRQQLQKAQQEMQKEQKGAENVTMSFEAHVRETGAGKDISGLATRESILTLNAKVTDQKAQQSGSMAITNDMWLATDVPGYEAMRDFYMRMAEKMSLLGSGMDLNMSRMVGQNPGASQAWSDMAKEMQKIKGVPVMQITRMGMTTDGKPLPAASEAPLPPDTSPEIPTASEVAKESAASAVKSKLGALGGFGGFGRKKKPAAQPASQESGQAGQTPPPAAVVLMETQTTSSDFSTAAIDGSHLEVPAGYKLVESAMR
ncbi:MAG: hypothetical protein ACLGSD_18315 [Acidobacteriota bacterium]